MRLFSILLALGGLSLFSCHKDLSPEEQLQKDIGIIQDYLTKNGLTAQSTPSGLHYIITQAGSGDHPTINSTVIFQYTGYLTDGTVFDQSEPGKSATYSLSNLIVGWQEGMPLLGKGGKAKLLIPSALGYGPEGKGSIPGNTVLIFDIQLDDFH